MTSRLLSLVVIGAGAAGFETVRAAREAGYDGSIALIGDEPQLPYDRPPLSKGFLDGTLAEEGLYFRDREYFDGHNIDLRLGISATEIDCHQRQVGLSNGERLRYDWLVFATGSRPARPPFPVPTDPRVHYLRTIADSEKLRSELASVSRLAVLGGGFIGLEVAATATAKGVDVAVVEAAPRLLSGRVSDVTSNIVLAHHREHGVELHISSPARGVTHHGSALGIDLVDDRRIEADAIVVAIGATPNTELASAAGLTVDRGVLVDTHLRTSDPRIFAIGDCARFPYSYADGELWRLESVQNAVSQGRYVAELLFGADPSRSVYKEVPRFWSHQGRLRLQMAGLLHDGRDLVVAAHHDQMHRVVGLHDSTVTVVETVNWPREHMASRGLIGLRTAFDPAALVDPALHLAQLTVNQANNSGVIQAASVDRF